MKKKKSLIAIRTKRVKGTLNKYSREEKFVNLVRKDSEVNVLPACVH